MTEPADLAYLSALYAQDRDPWHLRDGWYERRKLQLLLACLPRERYAAAFEPGCSVGEVTAGSPHVEVRQLILPRQWPPGTCFDLIVLSEIGYFQSAAAWAELCGLAAGSLAGEATVLACHWRRDFAERTLPTDALHAQLGDALRIPKHTSVTDADFVIDVWTASSRSVAQADGLA